MRLALRVVALAYEVLSIPNVKTAPMTSLLKATGGSRSRLVPFGVVLYGRCVQSQEVPIRHLNDDLVVSG